jgi:hypothetical protein
LLSSFATTGFSLRFFFFLAAGFFCVFFNPLASFSRSRPRAVVGLLLYSRAGLPAGNFGHFSFDALWLF